MSGEREVEPHDVHLGPRHPQWSDRQPCRACGKPSRWGPTRTRWEADRSPAPDAPQADGLSNDQREFIVEALSWAETLADGRIGHTRAQELLDAYVADRLAADRAARDRDHEAEVERRLAEQRDGITAAIEYRCSWSPAEQDGLDAAAAIARTYGAARAVREEAGS